MELWTDGTLGFLEDITRIRFIVPPTADH